MTECKRVSFLPPEQLTIRPTSVGRGMPNEECWLVDELGRRLPLRVSTGELVVRGSHVMRGYWEKACRSHSPSGCKPGGIEGERVLYTGDIFRTDAEGWLYFVARKRRHHQEPRREGCSPREVENALYSAGWRARSCAVIGVSDRTAWPGREGVRHPETRRQP
jgi:long-chain acyl-CoA synthetase